MLGGGMRQAGMLAAAGIYALQNNVQRMAEDHANAGRLAAGLADIIAAHPRLSGNAEVHAAQTNIVFMDIASALAAAFLQHLTNNNVKVTSGGQRIKDRIVNRIRWVTHLDVDRGDVEQALQAVAGFQAKLM